MIEMNEYIYYFLKHNTKNIEDMASGTTFKEISGKGMSEIVIPVPPLEEQKRIVDKIDENNRFSFNNIRLHFILELAETIALSLLLAT